MEYQLALINAVLFLDPMHFSPAVKNSPY